MNPYLDHLHPYPFEKLAQLKAGCTPPADLKALNLSIGEPQHTPPTVIIEALQQNIGAHLGKYPATKGSDELRETIANWLIQRYQLPPNSLCAQRQVLPVNGTREALFSFAQAVVDNSKSAPLVMMPNPFYQIYEGAAYLAHAEPYYLNCTAETDFQPDFTSVPAAVWQRCQLLYICSPNNPSGTLLNLATIQDLLEKADRYDFIIASDECYAELYAEESAPPLGLLEACARLGRTDYHRCVVFHSLSKRSSVPGLRSGFVAGDATILAKYLLYRTYHGCAMSSLIQHASRVAWADESHVLENRALYREKYEAVVPILRTAFNVTRPPASFYLWLPTPQNDETFTRGLFEKQHVTVLAGSYLSRLANGINPGAGRVRVALVPPLADCVAAAKRIVEYVKS